ncbi:hypothetical protein [Bacillus spizizenii]|nr:hypothetical protein [Bacillus spizizenii]MEC3801022.1 hypothetical protein [Bacillus spizizenii]
MRKKDTTLMYMGISSFLFLQGLQQQSQSEIMQVHDQSLTF